MRTLLSMDIASLKSQDNHVQALMVRNACRDASALNQVAAYAAVLYSQRQIYSTELTSYFLTRPNFSLLEECGASINGIRVASVDLHGLFLVDCAVAMLQQLWLQEVVRSDCSAPPAQPSIDDCSVSRPCTSHKSLVPAGKTYAQQLHGPMTHATNPRLPSVGLC